MYVARFTFDPMYDFQSPRGDFGFLKMFDIDLFDDVVINSFNPLAGILVF